MELKLPNELQQCVNVASLRTGEALWGGDEDGHDAMEWKKHTFIKQMAGCAENIESQTFFHFHLPKKQNSENRLQY